jgi:translation initiation factor 2-alpha kinase 4
MASYIRILNSVKENRYKTDFNELEKIGRGGFASVYKCKNYVDDQVYAVKKITLRIKDIKDNFQKELDKVLQEAKFLAKVNHPNIVRYYNSWLEAIKSEVKKQQKLSNKKQTDPFKKKFNEKFTSFQTLLDQIDTTQDVPVPQKKHWVSTQVNHILNKESADSPLFCFGLDGETNKNDDENNQEEDENLQRQESNEFLEFDRKPAPPGKIFDFLAKNPDIKPVHSRKITKNNTSKLTIEKPSQFKNQNTREKQMASSDVLIQYCIPSPDATLGDTSTTFEDLKSVIFYIQTELCQQTLEDYLNDRNKKLSELRGQNTDEYSILRVQYTKEALEIAEQILNGLTYIHEECQMVHRDLKPSNIFLTADKKVKIGDFGLVKKLRYFSPVYPSPILTATTSNTSCFDEKESFKLDGNASHSSDSQDCSEFEMKIDSDDSFERRQQVRLAKPITSKQDISDETNRQKPFASKQEISEGTNSPMTKSVGTRTFASPEQLSADMEKFDQRADIWSLGLIFLLLFHPMSTYMEQIQIINDAKNGKTPRELEKEIPGIARTVKKMLSKDPSHRPGIKEILHNLKAPNTSASKNYVGKVQVRKENASTWNTRWVKIEEDILYFYETEYSKKAESVYNLTTQWTIQLKEDGKKGLQNNNNNENDDSSGSDRSFDLECSTASPEITSTQPLLQEPKAYVALDNPVQLGCVIRGFAASETVELYKKLLKM